MTTGIRFPVDLPPPLREGYGTEFEETRSRQEREIGAARQRRKTLTEPRLETVTWVFTQKQFNIFDNWWQFTIQCGVRLFDIQLTDDDGGLTWYTVRWIGEYEAIINSERYEWRVTGTLRSLEDPFTTRPSGTDELRGIARGMTNSSGYLIIDRALRGAATVEASATARFSQGSMRAQALPEVTAKAWLGPVILRGRASVEVTAKGDGISFGLVVGGPNNRVWMGLNFMKHGRSTDIISATLDEGVRRSYMRIGNHGIR